MLTQLTIENIAVIERADVSFSSGMTVLTGETGAGKSILIDSIHAVLGGRVSRDLVRTGAKSACVTAVFQNVPETLCADLEEWGVPVQEDQLILQREIRVEGKTLCRVNNRPVTVSVLAAVGARMLTIHGQHESYELLDKEQHRVYVDAQGQLDGLVAEYRQVYAQLRAAQKNMDALLTNEEEKTRRADLLTYEIEELEKGAITPGEQEKLQQQRILFRNGEKTATQFLRCREALQGGTQRSTVSRRPTPPRKRPSICPRPKNGRNSCAGPITMYSPWPMKKRVLRDSWILTRRKGNGWKQGSTNCTGWG